MAPPEPVADCDARLEHLGVDLEHAALPISGGPRGPATCGAEQVVKYIRGPGLIRYSSPPVLTCTLALALARFENMLQLEAAAAFHAKVARIEHAGTYSCRKMSRFSHMVSEHSYANAIDIRSLRLDDGREISVVRHFGDLGAEPKTLEGQFLRRIARRAYDDAIFSVVLTPFFDALHRDHFHLDMARYRVDGTR